MKEKTRRFVEKARQAIHNRWLRLIVQLLVLAICFLYLGKNLLGAGHVLVNPPFHWNMLAAAYLVALICIFLGTTFWWLMIASLGYPGDWLVHGRVHLLSNLAKYLPGYIWQFLGKAYLSSQQGVSAKDASLAMALELLVTILTGVIILAMLTPVNLGASLSMANGSIMGLDLLRAALALGSILVIISLPHIVNRTYFRNQGGRLDPLRFYSAAGVLVISWSLFGVSFWLTGNLMESLPLSVLTEYIFILVAATLSGLLVIFVPSGIGVRESVMVFLLAPLMNAPAAVIISALSRALVIMAELSGAGIVELFYLLYKRLKRAPAQPN